MMTPSAGSSSTSDPSSTEFVAEYTTKDLILYALAVGFGSSEEDEQDELRYTFEDHASFSAVPSFPLVLPFWANQPLGTSADINPFPPPMMKAIGVLPHKFVRSAVAPADLPVIHMSQTISWHRSLPIPTKDTPVQTMLSSRVLSVVPKSVGTFVTSETQIISGGLLMCILESTNLVLGMPPNNVIPYGRLGNKQRHILLENGLPVFEWTNTIVLTQALLYRIASGDSNVIHVRPPALSILGTTKGPLLHGLCTLGIAIRGIMKYLREIADDSQFIRLEAVFTKPVFVGESLLVRLWDDASQDKTATQRMLSFQVLKSDTRNVVINHGVVIVSRKREVTGETRRARL